MHKSAKEAEKQLAQERMKREATQQQALVSTERYLQVVHSCSVAVQGLVFEFLSTGSGLVNSAAKFPCGQCGKKYED